MKSALARIAVPGLIALAFAFGACDGEDSPAAPAQTLTPELATVLEQVSGIRQLPAPANLKTQTVPRDGVTEAIDRTLTDEDRQSFEHLTTLYRLLGHLGPNDTYRDVYFDFVGDAVIGFYAPTEKRFTIVTDADTVDFDSMTDQQRSTVAHEFTHALQDSNFDLVSLFAKTKDDLDWSLALTSVLEGDAVTTEGAWKQKYAFVPRPATAILASLGAAGVPASIEREFRFPYTTGVEWVGIVRSQRGNEALNAIMKGRRITTAEIIHPDLYDANFEPEKVALPDLVKVLGGGWKHESGGAFGEFQLRNYLQLKVSALPAVTAANGWQGDRYDVYRDGDNSVAAFHVGFASVQDLAEFTAAQDELFADSNARVTNNAASVTAEFPDGRTTIRAVTNGSEAIFVIGSTRASAESAFRAVSEK